ncbi:MAG TPA: YdcF family protein [Verrucomicrobiae bacterium]|jgi:uncharacterized SAM-binding protein YcdF (DUF218 family)|nr:YdcF family protein [Verrucomicrobiae bacterium]
MIRRLFKIFLLLAVVVAILVALAWYFPQQILTVDSGPVKADALVVLGGGFHDRPQRGVELFKEGAAHIVICSGNGDAQANAKRMESMGVPPGLIELEDNSTNTQQNAIFTIAMLRAQHLRSAIIVTSWYHSRRALATFQHHAPDIKFYSRPSYFGYQRDDWKQQGLSKSIHMEYLKLPGYLVRYGVWPF